MLQEPTTAVDSVTQQRIAEAVARARADKVTVVLTEAPAWHVVASDNQADRGADGEALGANTTEAVNRAASDWPSETISKTTRPIMRSARMRQNTVEVPEGAQRFPWRPGQRCAKKLVRRFARYRVPGD